MLAVLLAVIRTAGRPLLRPLLIGAAFTLVTAPGPLLHDALVGGGTALADAAVLLFGEAPGVVADHQVDHSSASKVLLQLAVGLPTYTTMTCLAALVCRGLTTTPRRRLVAPLVAGWARG